MGNKQVKWKENTITRQKIQGYKVICLIPTVVKMRPYKKPDFVCAAPGQKGVGSVLRAGSPMFPPAGQVCCKMKQKWVVEDSGGLGRTHISLFASPAHQQVFWLNPWTRQSISRVTAPPLALSHPVPAWRHWRGHSQTCASVFLKLQSRGREEGGNIMKTGEITARKGR